MKPHHRLFPDLRDLEIHHVQHDGHRLLLLSDPLHLAGKQILLSIELAPLLAWMDGENSIDILVERSQSSMPHPLSRDQIQSLVEQLDETTMLKGEIFEAAYTAAVDEYRNASHRGSLLAGISYPTDPVECKDELDEYINRAGVASFPNKPRGLISPHIDYERGWMVYARVWSAARKAIRAADLAIIFGTDHYADEAPITLTRQNYATPFGILPTDQGLIEEAADPVMGYSPFEGELRHRSEHSIELAALWLHHLREGRSIELMPVLCGGHEELVPDGEDGSKRDAIRAFIAVLRNALEGREAIVIAAADLSHVGPAFGDLVLDRPDIAGLAEYDRRLMANIENGDSSSLLNQIESSGNRTHVCGTAPIYLALETLAPTSATRVGYQQCPADANGMSFVSICGHLLA